MTPTARTPNKLFFGLPPNRMSNTTVRTALTIAPTSSINSTAPVSSFGINPANNAMIPTHNMNIPIASRDCRVIIRDSSNLMTRRDLHRYRWRFLRTARRGVLAAGVKPATRFSLSGKNLQGCNGNSATMPHTFCSGMSCLAAHIYNLALSFCGLDLRFGH